MWKNENGKAPIAEFLGWLLFLSMLVQAILLLLESHSVAYVQSGRLSFGYIIYAAVGMLADTPCPMIALFLTLRRAEEISPKQYFKRILHTPKPAKTIAITGIFCALALSVLPSILFLFGGVMCRSVLLMISATLFAPTHILISYRNSAR